MNADSSFADLFLDIDDVSFRRMFGGTGVFCGGVMFALVYDGVLHLKTDEAWRPAFEAEDSQPFTFESRGKTVTTSYWRVPDRLLDEPDTFTEWARKSLAIARTAKR